MSTATIRDLRTRFPYLKGIIAREGELIVTDRGRPAYVLRGYCAPVAPSLKPVSYFDRLTQRQPKPLSASAARKLDDADRGER